MKIAIVTEILNTHSGSRAPIELALGLSKLKNQIVIAALTRDCDYNLKKKLERQKIKVLLFSEPKLVAAAKLFFSLKRLGPDIVSFHGTFPFFLVAKLSGIPVVKTYYGTQLDAYLEKIFPKKPSLFDKVLNFLVNKLVILIEKTQFVLANKTVAVSKFASFQADKLYKKRIGFCYLGAKKFPRFFQNSIKFKKFILSVSRFTPYKGFHYLIAACGDLPLKIVGSSGSLKYLKYLNHLKGENCQILKDVSDVELANLYKSCLFYASFDRFPFFGLPIVEAASFAKPTISLNFGAAPELIEDRKTGFIVKDSDEFFHKAQQLFNNSKLAQKMGLAAKLRVTKMFNWNKTANYYNKIFQKILLEKTQKINLIEFLFPIILLGLILRILFLSHHDFWFDEAFSFFVAKQNLPDLVAATASDNNPPLYYLILHFWQRIFGIGEVAQKSLSAIFGLLAIPGIFYLGKLIFGQKTALIASLFLAVSPLTVYFSGETRMYSQLLFLTILTTFFFFSWLKKPKLLTAVGFIVSFTLSLYTHYYAFLLFLPFNLIFLASSFKNYPKFILLQLPVLVLILPWLVIYFQNQHPEIFSQNLGIGILATFASFVLGGTGIVTLRIFFSPQQSMSIIFIFGLTLIFFGALFLKSIWSNLFFKQNKRISFHLLIILLTPIAFLVIASLIKPVFSVRPLIFLAPIFYLIVAFEIVRLEAKISKFFTILAVFLPLIITLIQATNPNFSGPKLKLASQNARQELVLHTSILTYYPFTYFHNNNINFLVTKNPLTEKTYKIIGGEPAKIIDQKLENLTLVEIEKGANQKDVVAIKNSITQNFKIREVRNFGEIKLTFFTR